MNDFLEKLKTDFKTIGDKAKQGLQQLTGKKSAGNSGDANSGSVLNGRMSPSYEINLVPAVKAQMIHAQRIRNIVLFICIVVSSVAGGVVLVLFGIKSGQDIALASKDNRIEKMSSTLHGYDELESLITIQSQLSRYNEVASNKTVLSRVFSALGAMRPPLPDDFSLSKLEVNLETNVVDMTGQVDARKDQIDYRVLEAFKKGVDLTKYDYGRYVDVDGQEIPSHCIVEADADGNALRVGDNYYAWWMIDTEDCRAGVRSLSQDLAQLKYHYSADAEVEWGVKESDTKKHEIKEDVTSSCDENGENCEEIKIKYVMEQVRVCDENGENCRDEERAVNLQDLIDAAVNHVTLENTNLEAEIKKVKIWRTPQFDKWYAAGEMGLDGRINGIEHFESVCYEYKGAKSGSAVKWNSTNDCMLAKEGLTISRSTNGRDESENLVLKFTAAVTFAEEFFKFENKHMIAIGPLGQNVTDSFVQIGGMFAQEAKSCDEDDTECLEEQKKAE